MMQVLSAGASIGSRRHPCHRALWRRSSENISEGSFRQHLEWMLGLILFQNSPACNPVFASQFYIAFARSSHVFKWYSASHHIEIVFCTKKSLCNSQQRRESFMLAAADITPGMVQRGMALKTMENTHYTGARPTQTTESRFACSLTPQGYKSINTLHTLHFLIGWNLNSTPFCNVCVAVRWEVGSFHSMAAKSGTTTLDESWFSEFHVWELALPSWQVLK